MIESTKHAFLQRFHGILDAMDAFEMDEEIEEINAQFEDILFLMESIDDADEDAAEEMAEAFEDLEDLLADYRDYAETHAELQEKTNELGMAIEMARKNMNL